MTNQQFEELAGAYNFARLAETEAETFSRVVAAEVKARGPGAVVLDIGCGSGIARRPELQRQIAQVAGTMLGVEPDASIRMAPFFDRVENVPLEDVSIPDESIDVAYSWMVMEHVQQPRAFMEKLQRLLKPGGVYYFGTPNALHYFTRTAKLLNRMRVDELLLRMIRGSQVDEYHYPTFYRFNHPDEIERIARAAGFERADFVYIEKKGPEGYMRGPLRLLYHLLRAKRRVLKRREILLKIIGRVEKPH